MKKINLYITMLLLFLSTVIYADEKNKVKEILENAHEFMTHTNYKAIIEKEFGGKKVDFYISCYFDGKEQQTYYKLQSLIKEDLSYELATPEGLFRIITRKDKKYKILKYTGQSQGIVLLLGELQGVRTLIKTPPLKDISLTYKQISYNGVICYEIIRKENKLPTPDILVHERGFKRPNLSLEKQKAALENNYPYVIKYIIGKDKPFLYSCEFFNIKGRKGRTYYWKKPQFNVSFDLKDFSLPDGERILVNPLNKQEIYKKVISWKNQSQK